MKKTDILTKAYFALWFLTCRNPRKISKVQSENKATIRPTGYVYAYPKCALAKAMAHDGCIVHIGVGSRIVARLDRIGHFLGASTSRTSDGRGSRFLYICPSVDEDAGILSVKAKTPPAKSPIHGASTDI